MRLSHRIYRMLGAGVSVYSFFYFFYFFFIVTRLRLNETGYEMLVDLRSDILSDRYELGKCHRPD